MTWFETLTGFRETSPNQVRENLILSGDTLTSRVNGKTFTWGRLETPSLGELRERVGEHRHSTGRLSVREIVADVVDLHANASNAGSLFQVASQFNLLEMVRPTVTPERGVGIYENDHTQGPACAIAAGAGTIYRNYFAIVNGHVGQSAENQVDCLADLGQALGNGKGRLWTMTNGYTLPSREGLAEINQRLAASSEAELDQLRKLLRNGIQWNTQVTIGESKHTVTQAHCSALPAAYSNHPSILWEGFARLVLEAAYEAALCAGILNSLSTGSNRVFFTLLGGGAFGNETEWITDAIKRTLKAYRNWNLDVAIVSYGSSKQYIRELIEQFTKLTPERPKEQQ